MKTEISKLPFNELKHYVGVQLQMGRQQLDSDWNEQSELWLRLLQRHADDVVHTGSPDEGFRVDTRILLDALDSRVSWAAQKAANADPDPKLSVDYFDHRTGQGSLMVSGAASLTRTLPRVADLSGLREVMFAAKGTFAANACAFFVRQGGTNHAFATTEVAGGIAGWRLFQALPTGIAASVLAGVEGYGFASLDKNRQYRFDFIKIDRPIRQVLVPVTSLRGFTAAPQVVTDVPELRINDDQRIWRSTTLEVAQAASVTHVLPAVRDLRRIRRLIVAARSDGGPPAYGLRLTDATVAANEVTLAAPDVSTVGGWEVRSFAVPQAGVDWSQIRAVSWTGLTPAATYQFSLVLAEMSLDGNLVIMGGDGTPEGAGRFYGDGLAAVKEAHETYFSQVDLPDADPAAVAPPAVGMTRADLAYLDLWERPVTYIEDPDVREIALEGPDTCTRTRLMAQVRVLRGTEVIIGTDPVPPDAAFDALRRCGGGTLTTKDLPAAVLDPCADPCEPEVVGTFLGDENRLYRVEIHAAGGIGAAGAPGTARFKWSRENAATASPLLTVAAAGTFSATVERPDLFSVDDLVEIADDFVDLISGPHPDRAQTRGELRRLTSVNIQSRIVSWNDPAAADPTLHAPLPRDYRPAYHAKVRRWDGLLFATPSDIVVDDGVVIEFGGADMLPGDYWTFTSRVPDRSVERLIERAPQGVSHRYYRLAAIVRTNTAGTESVVVDDLRPRFRALTALTASDVAFDPGVCTELEPDFADVSTVQEAIEGLCRLEAADDLKTHNQFLHGHGVVCGLKVRCAPNRRHVILEPGYALDCDGNAIRVRVPQAYEIVDEAKAAGLLDVNGNGKVCVRMERGVTKDADLFIEQEVPQDFWDSVLEGSLLRDFFEHCIEDLIDFFRQQLLPFPDNTVPVSARQTRVISLLNLFAQYINSSSGPYVFLSKDADATRSEHDILKAFYDALKQQLASETFCAMFDNDRPFPDYPYATPTGIETAFGLFRFHRRLRPHPGGRFAYTCLGGNSIQVFDLTTQGVVEVLTFPGGANLQVQDVAFNAAGTEMYVVGQQGPDSVFATVTIGANQSHTWGPTTVVCDYTFVTLATRAGATTLYAVAKSKGVYAFNPANIPLVPNAVADVSFNATGILTVTTDGTQAFAAESSAPIGTSSTSFARVRRIDLTNLAAAPVFYTVAGADAANDVAFHNALVHVTGNPAPGHVKSVHSFTAATGAPVAPPIDLLVNTPTRLAVLPASNLLLVTLSDRCEVVKIDLATRTMAATFRVPVQLMPLGIAVNGANQVVVLNFFSNTLSLIDVAAVITAGAPPVFTNEPPTTLSAYRQAVLDAFSDLLSHLAQYVKDCFCDHFLIDCPDCSKDPEIYLGCVEIKGEKVYHICNFDKRHYVKTFRTYGYWLSTVPVLPLVKRAFARFCCAVL